jgi:hypothetical protein
MPRTHTRYTRVNHKSTTKTLPHVEIVDSWDSAIRKAKRKVSKLKQAIRTFEASKNSGEPWPLAETTAKAG